VSDTSGTPDPPPMEAAQRRWPARPPVALLAVSTASVAVAVIHVAAPDLKFDFITVGLLAIAALPWLAPIIKSLRFGEFQIDLRDIKENLQDVQRQVTESADKVDALAEQVQQITFIGQIDSGRRQSLEEALGDFYGHMRQLGVPVPATPPEIKVDERSAPAARMYYDAKRNQIVVSTRLLGDTSRIMRSYATYLLTTTNPTPTEDQNPQTRVLLSGLAIYLPCSYRDDPVMGAESAEVYNAERVRVRPVEPFRLDGTNRFRIKKIPPEPVPGQSTFRSSTTDALAWGGTFWRIRELIGAEALDQALVAAWNELQTPAGTPPFQQFVVSVVNRLEQLQGPAIAQQAQEIVARRGLAQARTWTSP
jgi:hypothetical protein